MTDFDTEITTEKPTVETPKDKRCPACNRIFHSSFAGTECPICSVKLEPVVEPTKL
jgi:rubrerythrin